MKKSARWLIALIGLVLLGGGVSMHEATPDGLEITYIANEGVLIAAGDGQVLIDGLHRPYYPMYAVLPPAQRDLIETARPPFDEIDVILVSHVHRDHFHAETPIFLDVLRRFLRLYHERVLYLILMPIHETCLVLDHGYHHPHRKKRRV